MDEWVVKSVFEEAESFWDNYLSSCHRGNYEVSVRKVRANKEEYSYSAHNAFLGDIKVLGNLVPWFKIKWFARVTEKVIEWCLVGTDKPIGRMVADTGKNDDRIK